MPHVAFVSSSGLRVRADELRALGMELPGLRGRAAAIEALPSLGLFTLAGMTPPDWTASYREARTIDVALVEAIARESPTLVAITALTASIGEAYLLCDVLRRRGVRVVIGGLHASVESDEASMHADAVVIGDGETVWARVLADAERGALARSYRSEHPFDLAQAAVPRFDLADGRRRPRFTLQTARGCPFACDFCGASRLLGPFREKPADLVRRELEAIRSIDRAPWIELADDNTFAGRRDARELLGVLAESGARWFTEVDWRIGERPELLADLAASGCVEVLVGIESLVHQHAGMGAKAAELARMLDAIEAIQAAGVAVIACTILGSDGEDRASIERLTAFLLDAPFADVQVTLPTPFPGTELRRRLQRERRILADRDWSHYTLFDVTFRPDRMSVAELERAFLDVCRTVYAEAPSRRRAAIRRSVWERGARARS